MVSMGKSCEWVSLVWSLSSMSSGYLFVVTEKLNELPPPELCSIGSRVYQPVMLTLKVRTEKVRNPDFVTFT